MLLPLILLAGTPTATATATARIDRAPSLSLPSAETQRDAEIERSLRAAASARGITIDAAVTFEVTSARALGGAHPQILDVRGRLGGIALTRPVARLLVDAAGDVRVATYHGDVPPLRDTPIVQTADDAIAAVDATGWPGSQGATTAELRVAPRGRQSLVVWRVDPPFDRATMTNRVFEVDATTGAVRLVDDKVQSAELASFFHNPVTTPVAYLEPAHAIDPGAMNLTGPRVVARNCIVDPQTPDAECNPQPKATANLVGDFSYPTPDITDPVDNLAREDEFSEVSAYYHADKFDAWLAGFGQPGTPCQAAGVPLHIVANLRGAQDGLIANAFYTGDCGGIEIGLGQGPSADFAYDGDVVYHEVGHGVTFQQLGGTSLFGIDPRPHAVVDDAGGLSEGLADFYSSAYTGDPIVGDYTIARDNGNDFSCPADMPGQSHADSEVWAGALWQIGQALGDAFVPVVLDAVALFPDGPSYEEAAEAVVATAFVELGEVEGAMAEEIFTDRNLTSCERIVAWQDFERGLWMRSASLGQPFNPMRPPSYQIEIDTPPLATRVQISFEVGYPFEGVVLDGLEYDANILWNVDEPTTFEYELSPGGIYMVEAEPLSVHYDLAPDRVHGLLDVEVEGGRTYYAAFFNLQPDSIFIKSLDVQFVSAPGPGPGAGDDTTGGDIDPDGSGTAAPMPADDGSTTGDATGTDDGGGGQTTELDSCACRTETDRGHPAAAWWSVVVVACARRRRRATSCCEARGA
jgi:hypothetical protein